MDRTDRVFVHQALFKEVFPDLEDVKIEYAETGDFEYLNPRYRERTRIQSVKVQGGLIRCNDPACRQGGHEMDFDIQDMIRDGVSERSGHKICAGSEGSPKLRRVYRKCYDSIDNKITLVYKKK
jgi:hypothetical protein